MSFSAFRVIAALTIMGVLSSAAAQDAPLSARDSDPRVMGWMLGFPPPSDRLITQPDAVYFSFPRLRWSVCHLRQFLPTVQVSRGLGAPVPLEYLPPLAFAEMRAAIVALTFRPIGAEEDMTWEASLHANYSDGILILHRGRVVYERYFGRLAEDGQHAAMSMTKSVTGLLAEILVVEGALDETALVVDIIPEIAGSGFADASAGHGHDHRGGVFRGLRRPRRRHLALFGRREPVSQARGP